jgi:hypothetical protein
MTGLSHYVKAEKLLAAAEADPISDTGLDRRVAQAQVHATLALAAVTALGLNLPAGDKEGWTEKVTCVVSLVDTGEPRTIRKTGESCNAGHHPGCPRSLPVHHPLRHVA